MIEMNYRSCNASSNRPTEAFEEPLPSKEPTTVIAGADEKREVPPQTIMLVASIALEGGASGGTVFVRALRFERRRSVQAVDLFTELQGIGQANLRMAQRSDILQESMREVAMQLILPEHQVTDADVENIHWLFLARELESRAAGGQAGGRTLTTLIASLLVTDEFKSKLGLAEGAPVVSETMLVRLSPDLVEWIVSITDPSALGEGEPFDRITIVRKFLHDDRTREAVSAFGFHHVHEIDALNAKLAPLDDVVRIVGSSALFDASCYVSQLISGTRIANPAAHYVLHGERLGLKPSPRFDPEIYDELNLDVAASSLNRLFHYEMWGRQEGRAHRRWPANHPMPPLSGDTERPTVLLLVHEATYTGAPILAWNLAHALADRCNIVIVLRRGGALENAFRDVASAVVTAPPYEATLDPIQMDRFAERLVEAYRPLYVIANSVESRAIAVPLRRYDVPIVALIHEFWPAAKPGIRLGFYADCAALVFPAQIVEQSSSEAFREIRLQNRFILPQGPCAIPPLDEALAPRPVGPAFVVEHDATASLDVLLADGQRGAGPFTVIGLGAVEIRKGIDLFISAAKALRSSHPELDFRFIWIGTWEHVVGSPYGALLEEQVKRSGLEDRIYFFPPTDHLEAVYARADALFLSSRLDPLPNIVIDAAKRGVPVVCFEGASGAAELLMADPNTETLVVPHLDSGSAADRIAALATDAMLWRSCSDAMQQLARSTFNMQAYAEVLDMIGRNAAKKFANAENDLGLIEGADAFDASIYFGTDTTYLKWEKTPSAVYIDQTKHINFASPAVPGVILRRPKAGFHPFIYGMEAPDFPRDGSRDPLAHYVEQGMPEGRWAHQVLRPDLVRRTGLPQRNDRHDDADNEQCDTDDGPPKPVALHGHFHYADNIDDFLSALAGNELRADLFLTTTSEQSADILRASTADYNNGKVVVEVGPNVGRDIYAFLRVLSTHIRGQYELIGHVHGKRSVHTFNSDPDFGNRWRQFLWEHLLGPSYPAADAIVDAMQRDKRLGLVFPENGFLTGWEENDDSAGALAQRVGLRRALPSHIEFPAGTMFWARVEALEALVRADLREDEMPIEPLSIDGTMLHALERMLPLLCEEAGYTYATSYIPHISR